MRTSNKGKPQPRFRPQFTVGVEIGGIDPISDKEYLYRNGVLEIGCQRHTPAEWRARGKEIIARLLGATAPSCPPSAKCGTCKDRIARRKAAVRKHWPRLQRLLTVINRAEGDADALRLRNKKTV